ncbi:MarR family transcriptional regulator [Halorubrum sp. ASP121]|uniref:MarR family transcriptional regulator n=1 Tax=Halorubrum sp. ASP121 TaxID=1855858 RepID=UPI0010F978DF|nr:MarR family transcriptional regulator [Halorubrum sp. ASP121]TKX47999.1 MarR family transcriptional regulator [Halorubrum sp. ASP121]
MRKSGKWMVLLDERILELFAESEDEFMSPSEIAENPRVPYSSQYVGQRCRKLAKHGLLLSVGNGIYKVTDEGLAYLESEYNAAENGNVEVSTGKDAGESLDEA